MSFWKMRCIQQWMAILYISVDFSVSADSKLVVLTANFLGNAQSYLEVVQSNVELFRGIIPSIAHYSQHSVLLVASQPGTVWQRLI